MGLLQAAYLTYESQMHMLGRNEEGKELLTPISHMIRNSKIEITINIEGEFVSARTVSKENAKTIIPVTVESANRTGNNTRAHPLSDQLRYLAAFGGEKFTAYLAQLEAWAASDFTHPKVSAVLSYIKAGSIASDLAQVGIIELDENGQPTNGKIEMSEYARCLVRWQVIPLSPAACWTDTSLYESFAAYYASTCTDVQREVCIISGENDMVCNNHPKGVIAINFNAKLISANDDENFTYRGRFSKAEQAYSVGYNTSQKAHAALRWISANYGVIIGGRTFLCWTPQRNIQPVIDWFLPNPGDFEEQPEKLISYKQQMKETIGGYKNRLEPNDDVIIATIDATTTTTGRLSVTYYNELKAKDFLERIECWYSSFRWNSGFADLSPSLWQVVNFAFGVQRKELIDCDKKILCAHVQRLLRCVVDKQPLPYDIVRALSAKAGTPMGYTPKNHARLITTACAVIRKYYNDKQNEEVWKLGLDKLNTNRSYLFGRLLAAADLAECGTYQSGEKRDSNAIRMMSMFNRRPMDTWMILRESLKPYMSRLTIGRRIFYENLFDEILEAIDSNDKEINKELESVYLLGYSHQRTAIFNNKKSKNEEENENESVE